MTVSLRYSPNHSARPAEPVSLLVMHYTGMESGTAALEWLCNPASEVSAHYLVELDGETIQMVEEDRRAWHAGVSRWGHYTNINDISIGIEIVNKGHEHGYHAFPQMQMDAVRRLAQDIMERYDIEASGVVAHSDIAPERKQDPGEQFPWEWLAGHGVGLWHDVESDDTTPTTCEDAALKLFGYHFENEAQKQSAITAFQRRFRTAHINGVWDQGCAQRLAALLAKSNTML